MSPPLTRREQEVLSLLAAGRSDRQIADAIFISPKTVEKHVAHLREKLSAPSRAAAVAISIRTGPIESGRDAPPIDRPIFYGTVPNWDSRPDRE